MIRAYKLTFNSPDPPTEKDIQQRFPDFEVQVLLLESYGFGELHLEIVNYKRALSGPFAILKLKTISDEFLLVALDPKWPTGAAIINALDIKEGTEINESWIGRMFTLPDARIVSKIEKYIDRQIMQYRIEVGK